VIVIDTEVVSKSFIQMQLGYCREIAASSGGKYYPIADLTSWAVHDIVIQELERELLSSLQALREEDDIKRGNKNGTGKESGNKSAI